MKTSTQTRSRHSVRHAFAALILSTGILLGAMGCESSEDLQISSVGDTMAFDKTTLEVKTGSKVKLTFKNNGTSAAMQHDWVLTKPGTDQETVNASLAAGPSKDYLADSPNILAHTRLLKPGESDTITFTAPETPGDYPYVCTFPGHYPMMKGTLKVQ